MKAFLDHACRLGLVLCIGSTLAGSAFAGDAKVYPGVSCQASGSSQDLFYSSTAIANRTDAQQSAVCPIVRDRVKARWKRIAVLVRDRHASDDICCFVRTPDPFAAAGSGSQTPTRCSSGEGDQAITFDGPAGEAPDWGPYSIVCSIPAMEEVNQPSFIASYRVLER